MSQPSTRRHALALFAPIFFLLLLGGGLGPAMAGELGSATLQIAGTRLSVSPLGQTVPFDTPTLVETHLQGYDTGLGTLPSDLRVLGDFSGPGIEGVVSLSTLPNEPFRIPRLRVKGAYSLSNIRLVQNGEVLGYGDPRSVSINATQILITKVSARPLTQDEMTSYGIVLDSSNYQTLNLTFGFAVNGKTFDYNMPVVYNLYSTDGDWGLPVNEIRLPEMTGGTVANPRFNPPQMLPFKLELKREDREEVPDGGCDIRDGECRTLEPPAPPMVGVILFPTELTLLHQFFSVVLTVQNGAPEGDPLVIRDLTAKATLPSGLRPAKTEPPTPLGVPVPLRVPGPDGEVGTADDITFLIAQAAGEAEFLVEGLREGTHLVEFDMAGILEGLPGGPKPISGKAKGAVVVRDPTLSVTITHPDVVRAQEEYPIHLTVTNLGKAPVNALDVGFKTAGLAGTQVIGDATKEVGNLLPGDSRVVEFEMKALVTGRVVSSSARAGGSTRPAFELSVGVANGVPLSPETLVLPNTSKFVPSELYKEALGLIGLAYSLAKAPPSVAGNDPQATEAEMNDRVYRLSQLGRQISMNEPIFEAASSFAAEWLGARDGGWEWDGLRRQTTRGREVARAIGDLLAEEIDGNAGVSSGSEAIDIVERLAASNHYLSPIVLGAYGSGLELEIASRTSGKAMKGRGAGMVRDLPFAELYPLGASAELAMLARAEEGGYRARLRRLSGSGNVSFELVLPSPAPTVEPTRYVWPNFVMGAGEVATLEFDAEDAAPVLAIDEDGDGEADREAMPTISPLARRPFEVVKAILDFDVDLSAHVVEVLFSSDIDLRSIAPRDPDHFRIEDRVSNGGMTVAEESISLSWLGGPDIDNPLEGLFNPRIVRVVFNNPIPPSVETIMTVADLLDSAGREFGEQDVEIVIGPGAPLGGAVAGQVIDPYGQPLPYAEVSLFEWDLSGVENINDECVRHRTARTRADAEGRFRFDFVRQTLCGSSFELEAIDPAAPHGGRARGEMRYPNQEMTLNVVMLGRAKVRGKVTYGDGTVPSGLKVLAYNPVFDEGRQAKVMPNGEYQMAEVVVGTVTLYAYDDLGNRVFQTIEVPAAGAEVVRDLVMLKQSAASGAATLRGVVTQLVGGAPAAGAWVVLTLDGQELGVRETDAEGAFDFGTVPTGGAELVVYPPQTGRAGAKLALTLSADQNAFVELHLRDERGRFVGYVKRQEPDGSVVPVADAVVYVLGLPFNTRTDENGYYELSDVLTGNWEVAAADLAVQKMVKAKGTAIEGEDARVDLYFRATGETKGAIAGTVYGLDGQPVKGATLHLAGDEWSVRWHHEAHTDNAGRFRFDGIEPGIYGVHAYKGADGAIGYANVRFPGDLADIGIHFVRSRITGRTFTRDDDGNPFGVISLIRYRPVEVVTDWALVAVAKDYKSLVTNDDGTFAIDALPGPFELIVHNSFHGTQRRYYVLNAVPVVADIEFERSGSIHGVVVDHDGETPVPGVELRLSGGTFTNYTIHSDESGEFDFELVPPGAYGVVAIDQRGGIRREGFASVIVRRYGDKVDFKLVLPKQGTVYGQVFDADWEPVPNVAVTLRGDRYPRQQMIQNTDAEGRFVFTNVYAGQIALVGKAPELGGLGGKLQVEVGMEGEEVLAEIQLEGVGEMVGRIINPDHNTAVPNAEVRIEAFGIGAHAFYSYTINSDFEGRYRFDRLPLTSYRIFAFDPSSGRHGVSAWTPIDDHGQVVELDLELESRGTVEGHLYNDPSQETVPGATIELESRGMVRFKVYSSTDIDGHFEFGGIPEGAFFLDTTVSGRRARNSGRIETEDEVVTRDLHLEALARIEGMVRQPRTSAGPSSALAENVNVIVREGSRVVAATSENPFVIEGLLPGSYQVEAREIDGDRQVRQGIHLPVGAVQTLDLELRGFLPAEVHVFEANGQPAPAGLQVQVSNYYTLINQAPNGDMPNPTALLSFNGNIASGNTYSISAVRQGILSVKVTDPLYPTRKGSASAVTGYEGDVAHVNVTLSATGTVCGDVFLPDGVTPAAGARLAIKPTTEGYRLTDADEDGHFCFEILPRVNFRIDAQEAAPGVGTYAVTGGSWATGEYEKTYTIVLDDANPQVVSVSPANNSTGVPLSAKLIVELSEPVCRTCGGFYLYNGGGGGVGFSAAWSTDGKTVTLTPALQSYTNYRLVVRRPLADLSGREIAYESTTLFQTVDVVAPNVAEVRPANGTSQVPVGTTLQVTFSEPIDPNLAPGNFQLVRLDQGNFSETLIPLVIAENRRVSLTVTPDLAPDHHYELRVSGIRDTSGNVMTGTFTSRFHTADTTPPTFTFTTPAEGQLFKAGDKIALEGVPVDVRGVASVEYEVGGRRKLVTAAPWKAEIRAPWVESAGPVTVTAVAKDIFGNQATFTRTIVVEPQTGASPPVAGLSCPADGDWVERNVPLEIVLPISDDQALDMWDLRIDGQVVKTVTGLEESAASVSYLWRPAATAAPGTTFALELRVRDFAGQVTTRSWTVSVPTLEPIKSGNLPEGGTRILGAGNIHFPATTRTVESLTLLAGAKLLGIQGSSLVVGGTLRAQCGSTINLDRLKAASAVLESGSSYLPATSLGSLRIETTGALTVEKGARIDASGKGYPGTEASSSPSTGPAGVTLPEYGGGSHGGRPDRPTQGTVLGEVYGSVYRPQMAGGGATGRPVAEGAGGGVIDIEAGELLLEGEVRASGSSTVATYNRTGNTGAGGAVLVVADRLSGAGRIEATGGMYTSLENKCVNRQSGGGGGRVGLLVGELEGFDPAVQVSAEGGRARMGNGADCVAYQASPGTVYVKTAASTYGDLIIDAGTLADGGDRPVPQTYLPALGAGAASAFTAAGGDAWLSRSGGFSEKWHGVWVELFDAAGVSLGIFETVARDGAGRLRLAGAASVGGVDNFKGRYRFDGVSVFHGAGLQATDAIDTGSTVLSGEVELSAPMNATEVTVKAGAVVRPATGSVLTFRVSGTMTVEAGAAIDVTGKGYPGTEAASSPSTGPAGVALPEYGGGSHGGRPERPTQGTVLGEVYDSVYRPQMAGGGATGRSVADGAGGGVIDIEAGELVIEGDLRASGSSTVATYNRTGNTGAGGSVLVVADRLSGAGRIEVQGGKYTSVENQCVNRQSGGGGGRVGLLVGELEGFDPAVQVSAEGGRAKMGNGADCVAYQASPGTVYVKTAASTYGDLIIDAGTLANGGDRPVPQTYLPALGTGAASAFTAAGGDAWLSRSGGFSEKWHGVWVELFDSAGGSLGIFEAIERDSAGRLRLADAGSASGVASFKGRYRFDEVTVVHGAGLQATDDVDTSSTVLEGAVELSAPISASSLLVKAGAVVRPAVGSVLTFRVSGTMTVEAGAAIDVTGHGYPGTEAASSPSTGPAGVTLPEYGGGSHGGRPDRPTQGTVLGDVYDSVYRPQMAGGGATGRPVADGAGGGVIDIRAGELVIEGELRASGSSTVATYNRTGNTGAGGSVLVVADRLSGAGRIEVQGGKYTSVENQCVNRQSGGGGGRVGLLVGELEGFDPVVQVSAEGGRAKMGNGADCVAYQASPGTVYVKTAASTYGDLLIDAGTLANGGDRPVPQTYLPALGTGTASAFTAAGGDAWLSRSGGFSEKWHGVWVELFDSAGGSLGIFEAIERDSAGRLRLADAGSASGVASFKGRYRFDEVTVLHGAGLQASDEVDTNSTVLEGAVELSAPISASSLLVKAGAVVRPAVGSVLTFRVSSRMTVEAGAVIDVSGKGYPGTSASTSTTTGPAGLALPEYGGGSHGGRPEKPTQGNILGEVYDSVYRPQMAGGGATGMTTTTGAGGGVIDIRAGELVLQGDLRAGGYDPTQTYNGSGNTGAGGSVLVAAGKLSGAGRIDVDGGLFTSTEANTCVSRQSGGGGGRVGLLVAELDGFDPAVQVSAEGGRAKTGNGADCVAYQASPGTIYVKTAASTYGNLTLDAGTLAGGGDRPVPPTYLPSLGSGAASAFVASGADAWLSRSGGFAEKWHGVWVELFDSAGGSLGTFEAVERDGTGRLRLAGAGALAGVANFKGRYRFDEVSVLHGAGLQTSDNVDTASTVLSGAVELTGPLTAVDLRVKSGAVLRPASGSVLTFRVGETMTVEPGALIEVSGLGYPGTGNYTSTTTGPAGVTLPHYGGGSHGGRPERPTQGSILGEAYDSVYRPQMSGGGATDIFGVNTGAGGGVIDIQAGELVLGGDLRANGYSPTATYNMTGNTGAGGSVLVAAGKLSGAGRIGVDGGRYTSTEASTCVNRQSGGGGGRVGLLVDELDGFDPAAQVSAEGGRAKTGNGADCVAYQASPGTIYVKTAESTYGNLTLDAGTLVGGADRPVPPTYLPSLGAGTASAFAAAGADAWLSRSGGFAEKWHGVWVQLFDSAGVSLGTFEALERDGAGRLRLAGAGALAGVASFQGRYRFDEIRVLHGAGLQASDDVDTTSAELFGDVELSAPLTAAELTVKTGAVLRPASGSALAFRVSGTMTVEAGAVVEVSGKGYPGTTASSSTATGPAGVALPEYGGGNHGGQPDRPTQGSILGETYDSVYRPQMAGGGASGISGANTGAGGGVIDIRAGELVLLGNLRARGYDPTQSYNGNGNTGAGGSVLVVADTLSGPGLIDVDGGLFTSTEAATCVSRQSGGGGGRVGLLVTELDGFDPAVQVSAEGGRAKTANGTDCTAYQASPGTIYVKTPASTWGDLILDAGTLASGADRPVPATPLPALGSGATSAVETAGSDLWIARTGLFAEKWHGAWVELLDLHGAVLGIFEAAERDAAGRLRLIGAGSVGVAATGYRGVYRFDTLTRIHGAELTAVDPFELGTSLALPKSVVFNELRVPSLSLGAGTTLKPAAGSALRLVVPGTLTIDSSAKIDLTGGGYPGNLTGGQPGGAPAGITGSVWSGGSHGGSGDTETGTPGQTFGSVYRPSLGGGGAGQGHSVTNSRGGGVVQIEAGSLVLGGQILVRGDDFNGSGHSVGAGGSVTIAAAQLSGAGFIDASGGTQTGCSDYTGAGGGGRIALLVADLTGFDAASQARAYSGYTNCSGPIDRRAGAGTLYVKTTGSTYGTLRIDSGRPSGLTDRVRPTRLPILGSATVSGLAAAGGDAWLTGATAFPEAWTGVWVELFDASAQSLGLFEAKARDAAGRLRLSGAAGITGAATCRGHYRFDQRTLAAGASLVTQEIYGESPRLEGPVFLDPETTFGGDLTIVAGAVVKATTGGQKLKLKVAGTLTIEAGAKIDLSAVNGTAIGGPSSAGGSHGGGGGTGSGTPAPTYDSVYQPRMVGSAGSGSHASNLGGGVVEIEAGNLVLDGEILVKGSSLTADGYSTGAGGTVAVKAGTVSGSGLVDASGGNSTMTGTCWTNSGPGGGGRIAFAVTGFSGFDPLAQTRTWPGVTDCSGTANDRFAAAGTLYLKTSSSTYGQLVIDAGEPWNGSTPRAARPTQLPLLGSGAPSSPTVAGGDLWITRSGGFGEHWLGVFVELRSAAGVLLGTFEAVERNGSAALRLAGASAAAAATQYRGVYRFDQISTSRGAGFAAGDPVQSSAALVLDRSGGLNELTAPSLTVKSPATITATGGPMDLRLSGALTVETGAALSANHTGYLGSNPIGTPGGAPPGITGSLYAGGSHGGAGDTETGTPGDVYDSVYQPQLGGGGANRAQPSGTGRGGGVIKVAAGSVSLEGQILARGESHSDDGWSAGAGGSISIATASLSGAGLIDAGGGTQTATGSACSAPSGGGGGGRVAIVATSLGSFDPATQARAYSGRTDCPNTIPDRYAGAGTVYVKTAASTYGTLHLDPGVSATGTARVKGTNLPALGTFTASSATASGGDAWVQRSGGFAEAWAGVWVELKDGSGTVLGLYQAVERDAAGRLRLAGASAAASATATGRGYYRFDDIVIRNGAGFYLAERYGQGAYATGLAVMEADYVGTDFELAPGAVLRPATGNRISLKLSGTLTVGAGAKLDVSTTATTAPGGVTASTNAGGSHGGRGDTVTGTSGATYDSVYRPLLPGAPGNPYTLLTADGRGGGLLEIDAAKVVLEGELLARGGGFTRSGTGSAGSGGTVRIDTPELVGSGLIDASGGNLATSDCHYQTGAGGGGRVALAVADLDSFDVDDQVRAWAGVTDCPGSADRFAAAGTIYVNTAGATYGRLLVDGGEPFGGAPRVPVTTVLPLLGNGALASLTAAGGDAWLSRSGGFPEQWLGVWVELRDAGGTLLGTYRAAERDGTTRLRLAAAAGAVGAATAYKGIYRFDTIDTVRGGLVDTGEVVPEAPTVLEGTVLIPSTYTVTNLLVRNNAVVRPQSGNALTLRVSGTLTVEAGAKIDVGGLVSTLAPTGFANPVNAGGSHGGGGDTNIGSPTGTPGPTFDSVYRPQQPGSAGSASHASNRAGGVLDIEAGTLVLAGELNAAGTSFTADGYTAGSGGSVRVKAGTLSGAGSINASGGNLTLPVGCHWNAGAGGGGRVGLEVGTFSSFDPAAQVKAWAGLTDCVGTQYDRFAAAGTIYYRTSASTYGNLLIDAGEAVNGNPRQPRATRLPVLGSGTLASLTVAGSDALLARTGGFAEQWWGVWVELRDASDVPIGVYEAVERDGSGKLRLAGAASAVSTASKYKGIYRFDTVTLQRAASLENAEPAEFASVVAGGQAQLGTPFAAGQLTVKSGGVLKPSSGSRLDLRVSGALTVETGGKIDLGGLVATTPTGITASVNAGGSHGGSGDTNTGSPAGTPGPTFDSVYRPQMTGSPGSASHGSNRAGGVLDIEAGSIALTGELNAAGTSFSADGNTAASGGSIRVKTGTLSGAGTIDASGGNLTMTGPCNWNAGAGGGGRVGLEVSSFSSFDPVAQVKAWAGFTDCSGTSGDRFAAAGTTYYRTSSSTYGHLLIDAGSAVNSAPRQPRATRLPTLGSGNLTSLTAAGGDAWLVRSESFAEQWWGVWIELRDASDGLIGVYEAAERDGTGRLRLAGAASAAGTATKYKGLYRFDSVTLQRSASYESPEPMESTSAELAGQVEIGTPFVAGTLTVKSDAVLKPVRGGSSLTFRVSGTLTVEAGAKLDVSGLVATTPTGVTASTNAGGSHGGRGDTNTGSPTGTPGPTYDSVYRPHMTGSPGSASHGSNRAGGVIDIEAGTLALEGQLLATGTSFSADGNTAASGGTVRVKAGTMSGAGAIDASGGNLTMTGPCNWNAGSGGGGRVGLEVGSFSVFDPDAQVKAWAGVTDCTGTSGDRFAGAGTIYWKTSASTYGTLRVAGGDDWNGVTRAPRATVLPTLGNGSFTSLTAAGSDAWLVKSGNFPEHWLGVWIELKDASSAVIGVYEAVERNASGQLRLAGASGAAGTATTYRGLYRFDEVKLRQGSTLSGADTIEAGAYTSSWTPDGGDDMEALALAGEEGGEGRLEGERFDLAGRLFNDLDGDGRDGDGSAGSSEPPIVGARVGAYAPSGEELAAAVTDRLGRYRLTGIPAASLVAVDADSLPGGVDVPTYDADGIATADRALFGEKNRQRLDFGYRQAELVLPTSAPAPVCGAADQDCRPAERATPAPAAGVCLAGAPVDTVFLVDLGSLGASFEGAGSRLEAAQLALAKLERRLAERADGSRFALLTYRGAGEATEVHLLQGLSTRADAFEDRLFGLAVQDLLAEGAGNGSPAAVALAAAADLLAGSAAEGRQPRIVWLGERAPDVDARLRQGAGFGDSLTEADGGFRRAAEVVPLGGYSRGFGTFGGQATADAMVAIEEAASRAPGVRIDGIALRGASAAGAGRAPIEDLHDYAAAFTAGSRAAAADLRALDIALEDLLQGWLCAAR